MDGRKEKGLLRILGCVSETVEPKGLYGELYIMYNVSEGRGVHVVGEVKRVGNSLAVFIPAEDARRLDLKAGDKVGATIRRAPPRLLGLLKDLPYQPFTRKDLYDE